MAGRAAQIDLTVLSLEELHWLMDAIVRRQQVLRAALVTAGRGMGSPIPSRQEGAWTCEGPKFVDGGQNEGYSPLMSSYWNHERTWLRHTP